MAIASMRFLIFCVLGADAAPPIHSPSSVLKDARGTPKFATRLMHTIDNSSVVLEAPLQRGLNVQATPMFINIGAIGHGIFNFAKDAVKQTYECVEKAVKWVVDKTAQVIMWTRCVFGIVQSLFNDILAFITNGIQFVNKAKAAMNAVKAWMTGVYNEFAPLKEIWNSTNGFYQMATNKENLHRCVNVVLMLFAGSEVLERLSDALGSLSQMFTNLENFMRSLASKNCGGVDGIYRNIKFENFLNSAKGYTDQFRSYVRTFQETNETLYPVLMKLKHYTSPSSSIALTTIEKTQSVSAKFANAIAKIVPTWAMVEKLILRFCPPIFNAIDMALSLRCRVQTFVKKIGSAVTSRNLQQIMQALQSGDWYESECKSDLQAKCPTKEFTQGINDLLSKHAEDIGMLIAIVTIALPALLLALCVGGYKKFVRGEDVSMLDLFDMYQQAGDDPRAVLRRAHPDAEPLLSELEQQYEQHANKEAPME